MLWQFFMYFLKSIQRIFSLVMKQSKFKNWCLTSYNLHQQMRPSVGTLEITILSFTDLCSVRSVCRNAMKRFVTHRQEEMIFCRWAWSIRCSLFCYLCLEVRGYFPLDHFSILCLWPSILQISGMFLSLSFKTNAYTRQDLYDSKQYHFCQHASLQ